VPYAVAFTRLSFLHTIADTDEIAETTLSVAQASGSNVASPSTGTLSDCADAYQDLMQTSGLLWANWSNFVGVKGALIKTDGTYGDDPTTFAVTGTVSGSSGSIAPQCSVVLSLRTSSSLGKGNYGRMYLPHTTLTWAASGNLPYGDSGAQGTVAAAGATFVAAINTIFAGPPAARVAIMGRTGTGTNRAVTRVAVGRIVDTQRRRRNALSEDYVFDTV